MLQPDTPLHFLLGGDTLCRDGHGGHVRLLVVDPRSRVVSALVVDRGLLHHSVVVGIEQIAGMEGSAVRIALDREHLAALPSYVTIEFARPDPAWTSRHGDGVGADPEERRAYAPRYMPPGLDNSSVVVRRHLHNGVAEHLVTIGRRARVVDSSGPIGHLVSVMVDPRRHIITAIRVRGSHGRSVEVPVFEDTDLRIAEHDITISTAPAVAAAGAAR